MSNAIEKPKRRTVSDGFADAYIRATDRCYDLGMARGAVEERKAIRAALSALFGDSANPANKVLDAALAVIDARGKP